MRPFIERMQDLDRITDEEVRSRVLKEFRMDVPVQVKEPTYPHPAFDARTKSSRLRCSVEFAGDDSLFQLDYGQESDCGTPVEAEILSEVREGVSRFVVSLTRVVTLDPAPATFEEIRALFAADRAALQKGLAQVSRHAELLQKALNVDVDTVLGGMESKLRAARAVRRMWQRT